MKFTVYLIAIVIVLFLTPYSFAQYSLELNTIPPSPNAASLGKYSASPPDIASGRPTLSIPLTTLRGKFLELPIVLSYNNNGLQTKEEASWVGFGWSLSAGGAITRRVKGLPDENYNNAHQLLELFPEILDYWGLEPDEFDMSNSDYENFQNSVYQQMIDEKTFDPEPDVFYFSIPGYSGEFILSNDTAYTHPYQNIKIDFDITPASGPLTGGRIDNFKITTPDGTRYYFNEQEINYDLTEDLNPTAGHRSFPYYTSSWLLTRIETAAGDDAITLSYSGGVEEIVTPHYNKRFIEVAGNPSTVTNGYYSYTSSFSSRLSSISSSKMRVDFIVDLDAARMDLTTETIHGTDAARRLKKIEVYGQENEYSYGWEFTHDYFGTFQNPEYARLKLAGVNKQGKNGGDLPGYSFHYNKSFANISKKTFGYDHWGFYNGANNNISGIPNNFTTPNIGGANRSPSPNSTDHFTLSTVHYPTGGYTNYTYEANEFPDPDNPFVLDVRELAVVFNGEDDPSDPFISLPSDKDSVAYLGINVPQTIELERSATAWNNWNAADFYYEVELYKVSSIPVDEGELFMANINPPELIYSDRITSISDLNQTVSIDLDVGTYKLSVYKIHDQVAAFANIHNYVWQTDVINSGQTGPGLRVARMETYDGTTSLPIVHQFKYNKPTGYTSGTRVEEPYYAASKVVKVANGSESFSTSDTTYNHCTYLTYSHWDWNGTNVNAAGGFFGSSTHYTYVEESLGQSEGQGKTIYHYRYDFDDLLDPVTHNRINGQVLQLGQEVPNTRPYLVRKEALANHSGAFKALRSEEYRYDGLFLDKHITAARPIETHDRTGCLGYGPDHVYRFDNYYYNVGWVRLEKVITRLFSEISEEVLTEKLSYNSPFHRQVTSKQTDNHHGEYVMERYKYPSDYATSTEVDMTADYIIAHVIETQKWSHTSASDSAMVMGEIIKFNEKYKPIQIYSFQNENRATNPDINEKDVNGKYDQLIPDAGYKTIEQRAYDVSSGHLLEKTSQNGLSEGFIWSNDNNYLITHLTNASSSQVFYESFETLGSPDPQAFSGQRSYSSSTGYDIPFSPSNGSDYVISYYHWQGGEWVYHEIPFTTQISFNGTIDELRITKAEVQMQTYAYDQNGNMLTYVDQNNRRTSYKYDEYQRLVKVVDHDGNLLKTYTYNHRN